MLCIPGVLPTPPNAPFEVYQPIHPTPCSSASMRGTLYEECLRFYRKAFARAIGAFESPTLSVSEQRFLRNHMAAWHHIWWILVRCLLLGNGTDKDGVELVGRRQRYFDLIHCISVWMTTNPRLTHRELVLRRPLRPLLFHDILQFQ